MATLAPLLASDVRGDRARGAGAYDDVVERVFHVAGEELSVDDGALGQGLVGERGGPDGEDGVLHAVLVRRAAAGVRRRASCDVSPPDPQGHGGRR